VSAAGVASRAAPTRFFKTTQARLSASPLACLAWLLTGFRLPRSARGGGGTCRVQVQGLRAKGGEASPPFNPFPPCAARRRGGPEGGLGAPGLAPGPRPPRPHLRKSRFLDARREADLCSTSKPPQTVGEPGAACGRVSELLDHWIMGVAVRGGRLGVVWSPRALAAFARTK
jgi:hypothetical protein